MTNIQEGLIWAFAGMIATFLLLGGISFIPSLFQHTFKREDAVPVEGQADHEDGQAPDDFELIAAITAAIAMSIGTSPDQLVVRTYHRVAPRNAAR